jgi:hypothetical protein
MNIHPAAQGGNSLAGATQPAGVAGRHSQAAVMSVAMTEPQAVARNAVTSAHRDKRRDKRRAIHQAARQVLVQAARQGTRPAMRQDTRDLTSAAVR